VFLVNSRLSRFPRPKRKHLSYTPRFTIFRSYGAILQSSFDIIISIVLAFNAGPPVSVFGYGKKGTTLSFSTSGFSRQEACAAGVLLPPCKPQNDKFRCHFIDSNFRFFIINYLRIRLSAICLSQYKNVPWVHDDSSSFRAVIRYLYQHWLNHYCS